MGRWGGEERSRSVNMALYRSKRGSCVLISLACRSEIDEYSVSCASGGAGSIDVKSLNPRLSVVRCGR